MTKENQLDEAIKQAKKQFGAGAVMIMSEHRAAEPTEAIPTSNKAIDDLTGIGGLARGRITEIYGPEGGGKTTLCLHVVAEAQKMGGKVLYIDAEHSLNIDLARAVGVDVDKLMISQPESGEEGLELAQMFIRSGAVMLVVVDSVAALVPRAELEGDMGDSVPYETPVYIRKKGTNLVDIVYVGDLYRRGNTGWYRKTRHLEILTHRGWKPLQGVQRKQNIVGGYNQHKKPTRKPIIYTRTTTGYVGTTPDHSLFVNRQEASPAQLQIFDRVDTWELPISHGLCRVINTDVAWLLGFYVAEGSTPRTAQYHRFEVCNTDEALLKKCQKIIKENFSLLAPIVRKTKATATKKALYGLTVISNEVLGWVMHQCVSDSQAKKVPVFILNGEKNVQRAFLDGFWHGDGNHSSTGNRKFFNNSLLCIAGIKFINDCPTSVVIHSDRPNQVTLAESNKFSSKHNEIRQFYTVSGPEYLYDLETSAGTFVTAIGNIICHNSQMGLQARLMSQAMRKLNGATKTTNTALVFINQVRDKIGIVFGNPETTTGGRALKFYASLRMDCRRISQIKKGDVVVGQNVKLKTVKNKLSAPYRDVEVKLIYGRGFVND